MILIIIVPVRLHLFLLGGYDDLSNSDTFEAIAQATNKSRYPDCGSDWTSTRCPKVAVVTSAASSTKAGDIDYEQGDDMISLKDLFSSVGFSPKHVTAHIDNYNTTTNLASRQGRANLDILMAADVVYFDGGDQSRHACTWLNKDGSHGALLSLLHNRFKRGQVVIAGTSAGNAIMSKLTYGQGSSFGHLYFSRKIGLAQKQVIDGQTSGLSDIRNGTGDDNLQYNQNGGFMFGFNFIQKFAVDTHFDRRSRLLRILPDMQQLGLKYGIGCDQHTSLEINKNEMKVQGNKGVFIIDASNAIYSKSEPFEIENVRLHYLSKGDIINMQSLSIATDRTPITKPIYNESQIVKGFNQPYRITYMLKRLVSQVPHSLHGISQTPQEFPADSPTWKILFEKDELSKGYGSQEQGFTIQSIKLSLKKYEFN